MSRLMSVSHTADAVIARQKTVTRRLGWLFLKPGDTLTLCRKVMGRKAGEPLERLAEVEVIDVSRVRLNQIDLDEIESEGVPARIWAASSHEWACEDCGPLAWAEWFARQMGASSTSIEVTRIEWRYLP